METFKGDTLKIRHDYTEKKRNHNRLGVAQSQPDFHSFKNKEALDGCQSTGFTLGEDHAAAKVAKAEQYRQGIREQLQFNQTLKTAQKENEQVEKQAFVEVTN